MIYRKIVAALLLLLLLSDSSCTTKRDCRGRLKHKLPNGVWM
jgi:hypothetical protein